MVAADLSNAIENRPRPTQLFLLTLRDLHANLREFGAIAQLGERLPCT